MSESGAGKCCAICFKRKVGKKKFIDHHIVYKHPDGMGLEITRLLCYTCHTWLHGSGRIYGHPFTRQYGKDLGVLMFHEAAVKMYVDALKKHVYRRET